MERCRHSVPLSMTNPLGQPFRADLDLDRQALVRIHKLATTQPAAGVEGHRW